MSDINETQFGDWVRERLRARRMSIRLLGQRCGINPSTISRIVRGERRPTLRTAMQIVHVLRDAAEPAPFGDPMRSVDLLPSDPATKIERALRSDHRLTEAGVRRVMLVYRALLAPSAPPVPPLRVPPTRRASPVRRDEPQQDAESA